MGLWCRHRNETTPRKDEQGEYRRCLDCGARIAWSWPDKFPHRPPRLAGYENLNDAARLSVDPTFRLMGSEKVWERGVALTSTLHWFETDLLVREENQTGLAKLNRKLVAKEEGVDAPYRVVLDMDIKRFHD